MKKKRIIILQNWSTICSPISPPKSMYLKGVVYNHPFYKDGEEIITSPVFSTNGRYFTTMSGNRYRLGRVNLLFRRWMKKQYPLWNFREPLEDRYK